MSIHKRNNTDGSASYQVRVYVPGRGKVYVGSYPSARAAKDAQYQAQHAFHSLMIGGSLTLSAFWPIWLERIHIEPSTKRLYTLTMKRLDPLIGDTSLAILDKAAIEAAASMMTDKYEAATIRHTISTLVSVLNAAYDWHYTEHPPDTRRLRLPRAKPRMRVLSHDEMARMMAHDRKMLVLMGLSTGCRIGELMGLDWEHVRDGEVRVQQQYQDGVLKNLKEDGSRRTLVLPDSVNATVEANRATGPIFTTNRGRMTTGSARNLFAAIATDAGVVGVTPHVMRHTVATELLGSGQDIVTVAAVLGDKKETVLHVYAHVRRGANREAAEAIDGLLGTMVGTTT